MISIIIVTYNSAGHIARCLESLASTGAEIIVVDNASQDSTVEKARRIPQVRLIEAGANLGFAAACNRGARQARGDALLFLNPDTVLRSGFKRLAETLDQNPEFAAMGAQLVDAQGRPQRGFQVRRFPTTAALVFEILLLNRLFPGNWVNRRYRCLDLSPEKPAAVDQPAGAALLVRRSSFEAVGGFDERFYPLWFEDVDLCLRLKRAGGAIHFCPQAVFEHAGGHSVETLSFSEKQIYWYRNLLYYVRKNLGWMTSITVRAALLCGSVMRMVGELAGSLAALLKLRPRTQSRVRNARVAAYWRAAQLSWKSRKSSPPKAD